MSWTDFFNDLEARGTRGVDVLPYPHPSLRTVAVPVRHFSDELKKVVEIMFAIMYDRKGVGLAATQIGLPLRLFVTNHTVRAKETEAGVDYEADKALVFINPVVDIKKKGGRVPRVYAEPEGCLSIPGLTRDVSRSATVVYSAVDLAGNEFKGEYSGLMSRIVQHETDHLDGKLFSDRLEGNQTAGVAEWLAYMESMYKHQEQSGIFKSSEEEAAVIESRKQLAG